MNIETQMIFNFILSGLGILGGWALRVLWDSVRDLQQADTELTKRVGEIETLVAGDYLKRTDYEHSLDRLYNKLDSIDSRMQGKADR